MCPHTVSENRKKKPFSKNTDRNGEKNGERKKTKCPLQTNTVSGGRFHLNYNNNFEENIDSDY
tara:strand:+ start:185 stop:373 length:189 start_codon:yes stop_codon:yes gene_type:complete